jgi:hypothetical protein
MADTVAQDREAVSKYRIVREVLQDQKWISHGGYVAHDTKLNHWTSRRDRARHEAQDWPLEAVTANDGKL